MKSVKVSIANIIAKIFNIHDCVRDIGAYRVMIELALIAALVLLFALPAVVF